MTEPEKTIDVMIEKEIIGSISVSLSKDLTSIDIIFVDYTERKAVNQRSITELINSLLKRGVSSEFIKSAVDFVNGQFILLKRDIF